MFNPISGDSQIALIRFSPLTIRKVLFETPGARYVEEQFFSDPN